MKSTKQKDYQQMREVDFSNCNDIDLMRHAIKYLQKKFTKEAREHEWWKERCSTHRNTIDTLTQRIAASEKYQAMKEEDFIQRSANDLMKNIAMFEERMKLSNTPPIPEALNLGLSDAMDEVRRNHHGDKIPYEKVVELAMGPNIKEPERTHYVKILEQAKAMAENMGLPIERIRFNLFKSGLIKIHAPY